MLNSETFCMFYEKFEAYLPKILLRNYQRLKQTLPIWRYGVQKLNYQRSKLPILKVTNIEVYLYMQYQTCLSEHFHSIVLVTMLDHTENQGNI